MKSSFELDDGVLPLKRSFLTLRLERRDETGSNLGGGLTWRVSQSLLDDFRAELFSSLLDSVCDDFKVEEGVFLPEVRAVL